MGLCSSTWGVALGPGVLTSLEVGSWPQLEGGREEGRGKWRERERKGGRRQLRLHSLLPPKLEDENKQKKQERSKTQEKTPELPMLGKAGEKGFKKGVLKNNNRHIALTLRQAVFLYLPYRNYLIR